MGDGIGVCGPPSQLVLLPTGTGEGRPLTHDGIHHQAAAWTPDGKRIVFVGNEPGHGIRYYVQSRFHETVKDAVDPNVDGGSPRAITPENINFDSPTPVTISPDGGSVAVAGLDGKIALYPLDSGAPRTVPKLEDGSAPLRWCPGNRLLVYRGGELPVKILRVNVETGEKSLWKEWSPANQTGLNGLMGIRVGADLRLRATQRNMVLRTCGSPKACADAGSTESLLEEVKLNLALSPLVLSCPQCGQ